jgi:hypothetical protein
MDLLSNARRGLGRAGLVAAAATTVALSGCYSPQLQDCAVACASAADCGPGQACGSDGWCAGGAEVGQCAAPVGEPPPPPPPPPPGDELRVVIEGQGQVEIEPSSLDGPPVKKTCASTTPTGTTCAYPMPAGAWATLRQKDGSGWRFDGWSWSACSLGKPRSCLVRTGTGSTLVKAKFLRPSDG